MEKWKRLMPKRFKTWLAAGSMALYAAMLLPLYYLARYDVPSADDYSSGITLAVAMAESHNPFRWIGALWDYTVQLYFTLQGTFSSHFFTSISPLAFSEKAYCLGPVLILTLFSLGLFLLLREILQKTFSVPKENVMILFTIIAAVCIQMLPSAVEGFYWWSGAFLYTGFFSIAMLTLCFFLRLLRKPFRWKRIGCFFLLFMLTFVIGGSNFPTALTMWIVISFISLYVLFEKRERWFTALVAFAGSLIGLLVSVLAPGNSARMAGEGVTYEASIFRTLKLSFVMGFQFFRTWFTVPVVLALVLALPFLYDGLRETNKKFRWPIFFSLCTLCTYCALFTPAAHSYGWIGPARYMNLVYFGFVLLVFANEVYYVGWLCAKLKEWTAEEGEKRNIFYQKIVCRMKKYFWGVIVCATGVIYIASLYNFYFDETILPGRKMYTTESAVFSLKTHEARQYYHEYALRREQLKSNESSALIFQPYSCKPELLFFDDITEDASDWRNQLMAQFYGKESVVLASMG